MSQTALSPWNEKTTRVVTVAFFNEDGNAVVPTSASYSIKDVRSGTIIVASTPLTGLSFTVDILITAAQNTLLVPANVTEQHVLTVVYVYGSNPAKDGNDDYFFTIRNMPGIV